MGFTGTPAAERVEAEIRRRFPGMFDSIGQYNRRRISGTTSWSQHSWGNALDIMVGGSLNSGTPEGYRRGDIMYAFLSAYKMALGIRYILWRRTNHQNHIHVDFWPKGINTPPLDSTGIGSFQYSNGKVVSTRIQLVPPEGDWEWDPTEEIDVLRQGSAGPDVERLQDLCKNWLNNPPGPVPDNVRTAMDVATDGSFGPATEAAVKAFQGYIGLSVTGVANALTISILTSQALESRGSSGEVVDGAARQTASEAKALALTNQSKIKSASQALS